MSLNEAYLKFVDGVTSEASKNDNVWIERIKALETDFEKVGMSGQIARLTTAGIGLADESGEFLGLIKKILFHGKPMSQEIKEHLQSELSDILWYAQNAAIALDTTLDEVIIKNIRKLESRYPGGTFSIEKSENRKIDDI